MRFRDWSGLMLLSGAIAGPVWSLTWEKSSVDFSMAAGEAERVVEFPFKNEGSAPVTIGDIKTSCGCAQPEITDWVIRSGGKGVVKVVYKPGDRVGPQSARLTVMSNEAGVHPAELSVRVNIQTALEFSPRLVRWSASRPVVTRSIEIKQVGEAPVRILDVKPAADTLVATLKPGTKAGTWQLELTPKSSDAVLTTKVNIRVEVGERTTTYSVFAVIK